MLARDAPGANPAANGAYVLIDDVVCFSTQYSRYQISSGFTPQVGGGGRLWYGNFWFGEASVIPSTQAAYQILVPGQSILGAGPNRPPANFGLPASTFPTNWAETGFAFIASINSLPVFCSDLKNFAGTRPVDFYLPSLAGVSGAAAALFNQTGGQIPATVPSLTTYNLQGCIPDFVNDINWSLFSRSGGDWWLTAWTEALPQMFDGVTFDDALLNAVITTMTIQACAQGWLCLLQTAAPYGGQKFAVILVKKDWSSYFALDIQPQSALAAAELAHAGGIWTVKLDPSGIFYLKNVNTLSTPFNSFGLNLPFGVGVPGLPPAVNLPCFQPECYPVPSNTQKV